MRPTVEDLKDATLELFPGIGITIKNKGSEIFIDDDSDPLEGMRKLSETEDQQIRLRADEIAREREQEKLITRVNKERDRRIDGGFDFEGFRIQSRPHDRENIAGAYSLALTAKGAGAQPGDLRWHGGQDDFTWTSEDNQEIPMDVETVMALGMAALSHKRDLIKKARALKDLTPIPEDYATNDSYWT